MAALRAAPLLLLFVLATAGEPARRSSPIAARSAFEACWGRLMAPDLLI